MDYRIDVKELKLAMVKMNIDSYSELANQAKINRNTISDIVNGKTNPTLSVMYAISDVLGLSSKEAGNIFFAHSIT